MAPELDNALFSFRKLRVYQEAKAYALSSYTLLRKFPDDEKFAMCNQIRRAASSIPFNIAEGMGKYSYKDQIRFIEVAFGSLNETLSQFDLAHDLTYITDEDFSDIETKYRMLASCFLDCDVPYRQNSSTPTNIIKY